MKQQAMENLTAALEAIRESSAALAALQPSMGNGDEHADGEFELQTERLRHAEEVRAVFSLRLLQCEAEEQAAELIALDRRRRELVASLRAYSQGEFKISDQVRLTYESRIVSAAVLASERTLDSDPALAAAVAQWKDRLDAIVNETQPREESNGSSNK